MATSSSSESRRPDDTLRAERWAVLGIALLAVAYSRFLVAPCDDAYIFYVYAQNLLAIPAPTGRRPLELAIGSRQ